MRDLRIETLYEPTDEVTKAIRDGLAAYNLAITGEQEWARFAIAVRNARGEVLGGLLAELAWDWMHVSQLWLHESLRGRGIGTELLRRAEAEALARGITRAHLETTSFQALDFYLKNGYTVFAQLHGKPRGHTWYYLKREDLTRPER
ncbi:MAG: GNAT family N-acetyltransferase [Anaerolineae bacterium]|nr:GNAT family N-acetyltransferase [Anaerolineae bacterium]